MIYARVSSRFRSSSPKAILQISLLLRARETMLLRLFPQHQLILSHQRLRELHSPHSHTEPQIRMSLVALKQAQGLMLKIRCAVPNVAVLYARTQPIVVVAEPSCVSM